MVGLLEIVICFINRSRPKRIKNGMYNQRSRPGQTSVEKRFRLTGLNERLFYMECICSLNCQRTAVSLVFLIRTRIRAGPCHFVCERSLLHIGDGEPRVLGTEKKKKLNIVGSNATPDDFLNFRHHRVRGFFKPMSKFTTLCC